MKLFAVLLLVFVTFGCKSTDSESNSILKASRDETYIAPIPRKIEQRFCNLFDRNKRVPVAFFDADSTLRISKSGNVSANDGTDVNLLPFVAGKIRELNDQGYLVAVISNQGGVTNPRVNLPEEEARNGLRRIAEKIHSHPVRGIVHYIDYATGESGSGDMFRKGIGTGMATTAGLTIPGGRMGLQQHLLQDCQRRSGIDWNRSFMVGDSTFKKPKWKPNEETGENEILYPNDKDHPGIPYGRKADDFSNSDRKFAEMLFKKTFSQDTYRQPHVWYYDATDYFGWWEKYRKSNIEPDSYIDDQRVPCYDLKDILRQMLDSDSEYDRLEAQRVITINQDDPTAEIVDKCRQ